MDRQGAEAATGFERSARFWLRAYPRRWRAVRGDEVLGVLADLAGPGAERVDARTAVNLVRSGWATRWRGHPPVHRWLGYRLLDRSLPRQYREWIRDDVEGALYPQRYTTGGLAVPLVLLLGSYQVSGILPGLDSGVLWVGAAFVVLPLLPPMCRR